MPDEEDDELDEFEEVTHDARHKRAEDMSLRDKEKFFDSLLSRITQELDGHSFEDVVFMIAQLLAATISSAPQADRIELLGFSQHVLNHMTEISINYFGDEPPQLLN